MKIDINKIKLLISEGEISDALFTVKSGSQGLPYEQSIILLNGRFQTVKSNNLKGIISHSDYTLETNKIANDLIELITNIERDDNFESTNFHKKKIPEIILSLDKNKILLEMPADILSIVLKEIQHNIEEKEEPIFNIQLINFEQHYECFEKAESVLVENTKSILAFGKKEDNLENRKEIIKIKDHSKLLKKLLSRYVGYKKDLIRKIELLNEILPPFFPDEEKTEIFRSIIHITYNPSSIRSSIGGINSFSGEKEILHVAVYRKSEPKIGFNIHLTESEVEDLKQSFQFSSKFDEDPAIFLYERSAAGLPENITNKKVYPMIVEEVFELEKRFAHDAKIHDHFFALGTFEIGLA